MKRKLNIASRSIGALLFIISLIGLLKHLKVEPFSNIGEWYEIVFRAMLAIGFISCIVFIWLYLKYKETDTTKDKQKRG